MSSLPQSLPFGPSVEAFLLGTTDNAQCERLQQRLVYEASGRDDGQMQLLLGEHASAITIGRAGSRRFVQLTDAELTQRQLDMRWVARGGGVMAHLPGQLAVYPIVPLAWHRLTVGGFLARFQQSLLETLASIGIRGVTRPGRWGVWGRTGQLASMGVAVRNGVSMHGAFLNVAPAMEIFRHLATDPEGGTRMSSLVAESRKPVKMTTVRAELIRQIASAFDCPRYHIHSGHTLLAPLPRRMRESARLG